MLHYIIKFFGKSVTVFIEIFWVSLGGFKIPATLSQKRAKIVQVLGKIFLSEVPKCVEVVSSVKFSQESKNPFLMTTEVELRHEFLLERVVHPYENGPILV